MISVFLEKCDKILRFLFIDHFFFTICLGNVHKWRRHHKTKLTRGYLITKRLTMSPQSSWHFHPKEGAHLMWILSCGDVVSVPLVASIFSGKKKKHLFYPRIQPRNLPRARKKKKQFLRYDNQCIKYFKMWLRFALFLLLFLIPIASWAAPKQNSIDCVNTRLSPGSEQTFWTSNPPSPVPLCTDSDINKVFNYMSFCWCTYFHFYSADSAI